MKKTILMMTLMMCFVFSSYSQVKKKVTTQPFKFSTELTKLPSNFQGLPTEKTFSYLVGVVEKTYSDRGEFETMTDYDNRVKNNYKKLNNKFLYFSGDITNTEYSNCLTYNIDSLKFKIDMKEMFAGRYNKDDEYIEGNLSLDGGLFVKHNYTASNSYNASVTVTSLITTGYYVSTCNFLDSISNTVIILNNIQPTEAKDLKDNCKFLVLGNLVLPFLEAGKNYVKPTLDSPYETESLYMSFVLDIKELWFYDKKTGKIYKKIKK